MSDSRPALVAIPSGSNHCKRVLIIDGGAVCIPADALSDTRGFASDGAGGWIGAAQAEDGKWGYVSGRGQWIVPPTLDDAMSFSGDGLSRFKQNGKWGYLNTAGEIVIPAQFAEGRPFEHGLAAVRAGEEDHWRYIDVTGAYAFEGGFFAAGSFSGAGLAAACPLEKRGAAGYIDRQGRWAIEPRFKSFLSFSDAGVAPASLNLKNYGLIDRSGAWVLEPKHPRIDEFNDDGLAYYEEKDSWNNGGGYLNARGEVVVKGERHLSSYMCCGLVSNDYRGAEYLRKDGQKLDIPRMSWSSQFYEHGCAVARTRDFAWSEELNQHIWGMETYWGFLHTDGSFVQAPADAVEPLTNEEGRIPWPMPDTPLTPFLTTDGGVALLDCNSAASYRVHYENGGAALCGADGGVLWRSDPGEAFHTPNRFFAQTIESHLDQLEGMDAIVSCAEDLLAETESRLRQYAEGCPLGGQDEEDEDEDYVRDQEEARVVISRRLIRAYVSEQHNGAYDFLPGVYGKVVGEAETVLKKALDERFGEADPDPEHASERHSYWTITNAWPVEMRQPLEGPSSWLMETRRLWLCFYRHSDCGDGDAWDELWLMAAPSTDALQLARKTRKRALAEAPEEKAEASGAEESPAEDRPPETYEEWTAAVRRYKAAIGSAPKEIIDDGLVDAALAADEEALEYVPPEWRTPARLEALIRRDARTAANVPPLCMTAEGLALARDLYGENREWTWRDDENSKLPDEWDRNSLYGVWGALLTEKHCILALKGGAPLSGVPSWLRSARVEQAALSADIYNISYIDKAKITPALAARAVRHSYGKLIEVIPRRLVTPELCLVSARTNGLSLEHIPEEMRDVGVCVAALRDDFRAFVYVPSAIREAVCTQLIEQDLAAARDGGEERTATRWHGYRAWSRLWLEDYEGAIEDARLAVDQVSCPQNAHYVLAAACRALGRKREAALEAAVVLSLEDPYRAEFSEDEDTSWLKELTEGVLDGADDATIIRELKERPLALANVPRERMTDEMVRTALEGDPEAIRHVPKRLMTSERYAIALQKSVKLFRNIPAHMLSEAACIEHVRDRGYNLKEIPLEWRTVEVCAHAIHDTSGVIEHVPENIREGAQEAAKALPVEEAADEGDDSRSHGLTDAIASMLVDSLIEQARSGKEPSKAAKFKTKALFGAFAIKSALSAKSDKPIKLKGLAGRLERRPFAFLMINGLAGMIALLCHLCVVVEAWRTDGPWIGLATAIFMGLAEIYWAWRAFFDGPVSLGLGAASAIVLLFTFAYVPLRRKVARAIVE